MGCCSGGVALPREAPSAVTEPVPGTSRGQASLSAHLPRRSAGGGPPRAGGRTVNHFLAAVRRGGLESVPTQLFQAYARYLNLDPDADADLLWIVELAARAPTPVGWTEHFDSQGRLFYYHAERRSSWWTHPLEDEHRDVHRRITEFRDRGANANDMGLGGLRGELWQLEAEATEAELSWMEHWDQDGHIFYFNRRERLSSWTDPRPAIRHRLLLRQRAVRTLLGCPEPPEEEAPYLEVEPDRPAWLEEREKRGDCAPDDWTSPRLLLMERAAECPVCYDPLWRSRPSVLTSADGRRICGHYFCLSCAQRLQTGCAVCRAQSADGEPCRARALPAVEKRPWQWFAMVDVDCDGRLEQVEAVKALEAVLPLDGDRLWRALGTTSVEEQRSVGKRHKFAKDLSPMSDVAEEINPQARMPRTLITPGFGAPRPFLQVGGAASLPPLLEEDAGGPLPLPPPPHFDADHNICFDASKGAASTPSKGSGWWLEWEHRQPDECGKEGGGISAEAFCAEGGMLQWIVENLGELRRAEEAGEPPELEREELERWFDFWDVDADGGLSRAELLRALMKTLRVSGVERRRVNEIRSTIEQCFYSWAQDSEEKVSREAFLSKPDGLGELLLAALFPASQKGTELHADINLVFDDDSQECPPQPPEALPSELQEQMKKPMLRSESGLLSHKLLTLRNISSDRSDCCARI